MRLKSVLIIVLLIVSKTFSQENQNVLFTINDESFYTQEFLTVYQKNLKFVVDKENDIEDYLKLFIDYKLKVKEAKLLGLDTIQKFKSELKKYKENLVLPYLKDEKITKKLVKQAYSRLKKEVDVSHILIFLKLNATPQDTLKAYTNLVEARNLIIEGADFAKIARKYSKDPSVEQNGGNIGYFTVLQMVYQFENVAFTTQVNEVSMPFKTKFGYHILKVNDKRDSRGEVEVAHIMLKNNATAKRRIDSVHNILLNTSANFAELAKKISEDRASALKGGRLKKFGSGKMIESFADVAFSLQEGGAISKPFKTQYGWHIIKLIKKYQIESFDKLEAKLTQKVEKDARSNLISKSVIDKLFNQYKVIVNEQALQYFKKVNWKVNPEYFQQKILSINNKDIFQNKFITYLKTQKHTPLEEAFIGFKEREVLNYYKENIEYLNEDFAVVYNEFKEGLLLFDLLEKQVWEKAKDNVGLLNYFNANKTKKYKTKELKEIKGVVVSDYQKELELMLLKLLHKKYDIHINKSEKNRIKKLNL